MGTYRDQKYFYNDIINLKNFDSKLLRIGKKHYKGTKLDTSRLKKNDECGTLSSVNQLY